MDRFSIEQVIRILGLSIRAEQADGGNDFDVACRMALDKIRKAKHYEDLEEKGLLVELPCKVGDTIYLISEDCGGDTIFCRYQDCTSCIDIHRYVEGNSFELYMFDEIGKTVFLTKSEAEQALKEMEK